MNRATSASEIGRLGGRTRAACAVLALAAIFGLSLPAFAQTLTPGTLSFGNQVVLQPSAQKTTTFKNTRATALTIASITISGGNAAGDYARTHNCPISPATLAAGASCSINVILTPSVLGNRTATLSVARSGPGGPQNVGLTGTGVAPVTLSPATLSFSNQAQATTSAAKTATLKNVQAGPLTITSIVAGGDFAQSGGTCPLSPATLAGGASCTILVTFTPTALGTRNGALTVTDNASNSPQTEALTGNGIAPVTLSTNSLNWNNVAVGNTGASKSVTLTNKKNVALAFSSIIAAGDFAIATNTCGASIAAGDHCTVSVTFSPTALGDRVGSLTFTDDAANSPQTVSLSGTGTSPVTVSPTSLTFPSRRVGTTSAVKTVTLTNKLTSSLAISSIVAGANFSIVTNTCGASLLAGHSCSIGVAFSPAVVGVIGSALTINDSAFGSPRLVSLTGTGNASGLTSITVTPADPTIDVAAMQQFTATGHFSSIPSTYDLTASVTWASLTPSVATIDLTGLATGVSAGPTTISATLGAISGSTTLTVNSAVSSLFTPTDSMDSPRVLDTATLLNNGKVLVTGGYDGSAYLSSAELYDPADGTFTATGSMYYARFAHTATLLNNGKVLVTGGSGYSGRLSSAELYDPATGLFTPTGSMNSARYVHTATLLKNGMVLVTGGSDNINYAVSSAELYDPATGLFTPTGSMDSARIYHTATLLNNGMVLVTGGSTNVSNAVSSAELFDSATGTFTPTTGDMNSDRYAHTATLLNSGMVLVTGGADDVNDTISSAELYDPVTETFTATDSMDLDRYVHTATLLNNGKVLVTGGVNDSGYLSIAELYDPATGLFTPTDSMIDARVYPTATLLNSGKVLVTSGQNDVGGILSSTELYDPATLTPTGLLTIDVTPVDPTISPTATQQFIATGTFTGPIVQQLASVTWSAFNDVIATISNDSSNHGTAQAVAAGNTTISACTGALCGSTTLTVRPTGFVATDSMDSARELPTATLLNNGKVLVTGGDNGSSVLASAELYDPATGLFTATDSMDSARFAPTATLLNNGKVLVTGGYDGGGFLTSAELYDPATGLFTATDSMDSARFAPTATLLNNGKVLVTGGYDGGGFLTSAELYDPATGLFTATDSMDVTRGYHTATLLNNGKVLVTGGYDNNGPLASAELYDPATGLFTATDSMDSARYYHTATLLNNGKVLVTGGYGSSGPPLASAELYDPATGLFTATDSMDSARAYHTATLLNNGKVLVTGGYDNSGPLASAELYDPATGLFTATDSMDSARGEHTATLLNNGKVLITGGVDGSIVLSSSELY